MKSSTLLYVILYLVLSAIPIFLSFWLSVFFGFADYLFIFFFGIFNLIFTITFIKWDIRYNIFYAYVISALGLIFSYFVSMLSAFILDEENVWIRIVSIAIFQILLILLWNKYHNKFNFLKLIFIPLSAIMVFVDIQMKGFYYEGKFTTKRTTDVTLKIVDKKGKLRIGDSIEIREHRQPLYSMREVHTIDKGVINESSQYFFKISPERDYDIIIENLDLKYEWHAIYAVEVDDEPLTKTIKVEPK